jgi:hypothetical protein
MKDNFIEFNLDEINRTQDVRRAIKNNITININRYSTSKLKKEAETLIIKAP